MVECPRLLPSSNDVPVCRRLNTIGARGLVVYCLTITFVFVDWVMSLTPHWYSTIFGMLAIVSQALSTLALMLVLLAYLAGDVPLLREVPSGFLRDLGSTKRMWHGNAADSKDDSPRPCFLG